MPSGTGDCLGSRFDLQGKGLNGPAPSRIKNMKIFNPQITGQYGSDPVATMHCTLGTRIDSPPSAGNKVLDIPRMWTKLLGCLIDINHIWSQAIPESANHAHAQTVLQRKADLPTRGRSSALAIGKHAGEQIDVDVFGVDVLQRNHAQCGEKLLAHDDG